MTGQIPAAVGVNKEMGHQVLGSLIIEPPAAHVLLVERQKDPVQMAQHRHRDALDVDDKLFREHDGAERLIEGFRRLIGHAAGCIPDRFHIAPIGRIDVFLEPFGRRGRKFFRYLLHGLAGSYHSAVKPGLFRIGGVFQRLFRLRLDPAETKAEHLFVSHGMVRMIGEYAAPNQIDPFIRRHERLERLQEIHLLAHIPPLQPRAGRKAILTGIPLPSGDDLIVEGGFLKQLDLAELRCAAISQRLPLVTGFFGRFLIPEIHLPLLLRTVIGTAPVIAIHMPEQTILRFLKIRYHSIFSLS